MCQLTANELYEKKYSVLGGCISIGIFVVEGKLAHNFSENIFYLKLLHYDL